MASLTCTLVFYEAPHRIEAALEDMREVLGDREVCVAREITKVHEEYVFGKLSDVRSRITAIGEFVVVVGGSKEIREAAPLTRAAVLKKLEMTRNELSVLFFQKKEERNRIVSPPWPALLSCSSVSSNQRRRPRVTLAAGISPRAHRTGNPSRRSLDPRSSLIGSATLNRGQ